MKTKTIKRTLKLGKFIGPVYMWRGQPILCANYVSEELGYPLPKRLTVIVSKRPMAGASKWTRGTEALVYDDSGSRALYSAATVALDRAGIDGTFYLKLKS